MTLVIEDYENALKDVATKVQTIRAQARDVKQQTATSIASLQALPAKHAEVFTAIQSIDPQTGDVFEQLLRARYVRLLAEVDDLALDLNAARDALALLDL